MYGIPHMWLRLHGILHYMEAVDNTFPQGNHHYAHIAFHDMHWIRS